MTEEELEPDPAANLPRWARLPGIGRVQVLSYEGNGRFTVLDRRDVRRLVHRDRLTFTKR